MLSDVGVMSVCETVLVSVGCSDADKQFVPAD